MGFSPVLDPDKLYLELAFLMMFSWIWDHSLSVLHLGHTHKNYCRFAQTFQKEFGKYP